MVLAAHDHSHESQPRTVWVGADPDTNTESGGSSSGPESTLFNQGYSHVILPHAHSPPQPGAFDLLDGVADDAADRDINHPNTTFQ